MGECGESLTRVGEEDEWETAVVVAYEGLQRTMEGGEVAIMEDQEGNDD